MASNRPASTSEAMEERIARPRGTFRSLLYPHGSKRFTAIGVALLCARTEAKLSGGPRVPAASSSRRISELPELRRTTCESTMMEVWGALLKNAVGSNSAKNANKPIAKRTYLSRRAWGPRRPPSDASRSNGERFSRSCCIMVTPNTAHRSEALYFRSEFASAC